MNSRLLQELAQSSFISPVFWLVPGQKPEASLCVLGFMEFDKGSAGLVVEDLNYRAYTAVETGLEGHQAVGKLAIFWRCFSLLCSFKAARGNTPQVYFDRLGVAVPMAKAL